MQQTQTPPAAPEDRREQDTQMLSPPPAQGQQAQPAPPPPGALDWREQRHLEHMQRRVERHEQNQKAGVPFWGLLLIALGLVIFFGQLGIGVGWIFGLALGAWFVYLGARPAAQGQPINWWLTGIGLLIGLGAVSTNVTGEFVFPAVLILVGLGLLGEQIWSRQDR